MIDVITITRNDLKGLVRTVKSVADQTEVEVNHIIIDGNSSDGTQDWLNEYAQHLTWVSESDDGIYDAMNKGLKYRTGRISVWLNSADVFADPGTLSRVAKSWQDSGWQWAYGNMAFYTSDPSDAQMECQQTPFNMRLLALGLRWLPFECCFFENDFLSSIGPTATDLGSAADQELLIRAATYQHPVHIANVAIRMEAGGTHAQLDPREREIIWHEARKRNKQLVCNSQTLDRAVSRILPVAYRVHNYWMRMRHTRVHLGDHR